MDVEHCLYRGPGRKWLAVKNHSVESRTSRFTVATGFRPGSIRELLSDAPIDLEGFAGGCATFALMPEPNSVRIYELGR